MATNTGSNGGKNNTGYIKSGAGSVDQSSGLASALNQASYRREYNEKMFSDNGYLKSSIDDLEAQQKALKKILETSEKLTASEKTRFKNSMEAMNKIAREQKEMFSKQEASAKEIQDSLNKSAKARLKTIDDIYSHWHAKMNDQDKNMQGVIDRRLQALANQSREIKADVEDINEATDNFNKSQKSFKEGLGESVKNFTKAATSLVNMLNLENIANNEYAKKANERYETINKINRSLGFSLTEGNKAYSSLINEFQTFNNNVGNLFNMDDLKEYFQNASTMGLTNQKALEDSLNQNVIANKYMGLSYDTQASMYKYMKLTNNNESIANYNKMMVALTRKGIGVNEDVLSQLIKDGQNVNDILVASGIDMNKYNEGKQATFASLQAEGIDADTAKAMVGMVDKAIQDLYNGDYQSLATKNISAFSLDSMLKRGASYESLYRYIVGNTNASSAKSRGFSGVLRAGALNNALGISADESNLSELGASNADEISKNINDLLEERKKTSDKDVEQYVKQNIAISDLTRVANKNNVWLEKTFGNSWFNYDRMAQLAFGAAIAGNVFNIIGGIGKGIGSLVKFFGAGKGAKGLATLLGGTEASSGLLASSGSLVTALSTAAAVTAPIAIAAGIGKLSDYFDKKSVSEKGDEYALKHPEDKLAQTNNLYKELKGTNSVNQNYWDDSSLGGTFRYLGTGFAELWNRTAGRIGGAEHDNKNYLNIIRNNERQNAYWHGNNGQYMSELMYYVLLDKANMLSQTTGFTADELKETLKAEGLSPNDIWNALNSNDSFWKWSPKTSGGHKLEKEEVLNDRAWFDKYLMSGLDYVPRDGIRAMLHKGEMVLNREDADAYRNAFGYGGSLNPKDRDYVGAHHAGYAGHQGIDLYFNKVGTPVGSAVAGTVVESKDIPVNWKDGKKYHGTDSNGTHYSSYGRVVKVKGKENGKTYIYAHLNKRAVNTGDSVSAGTLLGWSGSTGNSSGPHLHFQVGNAYGEAAHAKYYTNYVRSANGAAAEPGVYGSTKKATSGETSGAALTSGVSSGLAKVNTTGHRAVPGLGGGNENIGNPVGRIVNSVNGVSAKIIDYLETIRKEQEDQRRILNAFSMSQQGIESYD